MTDGSETPDPRIVAVGTDRAEWEPAIQLGHDTIADAELVVLPTDTVYGVACDPFSLVAVARLFQAKRRGRDLPLPVFVHGWRQAVGLVAELDDRARDVMSAFWPGPLTVVLRQAVGVGWDLGDARGTVALRMPRQDFTLALVRRTGPLAVTSANRSGAATPASIQGVVEQLGGAVRAYFDAGPSPGGPASTILDLTGDSPRLLRVGGLPPEALERVLGVPVPGSAAEPA